MRILPLLITEAGGNVSIMCNAAPHQLGDATGWDLHPTDDWTPAENDASVTAAVKHALDHLNAAAASGQCVDCWNPTPGRHSGGCRTGEQEILATTAARLAARS